MDAARKESGMTRLQILAACKWTVLFLCIFFQNQANAGPRDEFLEYVGPPNPKFYLSFYKKMHGQRKSLKRDGTGQPTPGEKFFIIAQEQGWVELETVDGYKSSRTGTGNDGRFEKKFIRRFTDSDPEMVEARDRLITDENNILAQQRAFHAAKEKERIDRESLAKAKVDAERNVILQRQKEFLTKHGNAQIIPIENFNANPFVYEGKVVALHGAFETMTAKDVGLFQAQGSAIVFSKIPNGTFTKQASVFIAGEVLGKTDARLPILGIMQVPHLRFVGVHFCSDSACSEMIPRR